MTVIDVENGQSGEREPAERSGDKTWKWVRRTADVATIGLFLLTFALVVMAL
jgi:hypothetical protein